MAPYQGVNALDAMTLAYNAVSMLRQQTKEYDRIHFIIDKGGDFPNVIPTKASSSNQVRSATMKELRELKAKVKKCFEGAAISTGCTVEFTEYVVSFSTLDRGIGGTNGSKASSNTQISDRIKLSVLLIRLRCPSLGRP